jgi:signal peptidase I
MDRPAHAKRRWLVALVALLAPGAGHALVGHTLRGAIWAAAPVAVVVIVSVVATGASVGALFAILGTIALVGYLGSVVDAAALSPARHRETSMGGVIALVLAPVVVSVPMALFLRATVVQAFKVPSGAMVPTILVGDHLFVDMRVKASAVHRGDVIVFQFPERPEQDFIKRVIAAPGDKLEVRAGHPVLNGWEVPSCRVGAWRYTDSVDGAAHEGDLYVEFLERAAYLVFFDQNALSSDYQGPFVSREGELWVLGDNRNNSHDSRMWFGGQGGGVPPANVRGRAGVIWLSTAKGPSRFGVDVSGAPIAPSPELAAPLAKCMAERPSVEKATPPPPR